MINPFGKVILVVYLSRKTKTSLQEKTPLPNTNRFTSPITAFRRKKKTPSHTNDPGKFLFFIKTRMSPQTDLRFSFQNRTFPSTTITSFYGRSSRSFYEYHCQSNTICIGFIIIVITNNGNLRFNGSINDIND